MVSCLVKNRDNFTFNKPPKLNNCFHRITSTGSPKQMTLKENRKKKENIIMEEEEQ
jgi:hypothetical protein